MRIHSLKRKGMAILQPAIRDRKRDPADSKPHPDFRVEGLAKGFSIHLR
jgi:hypothetical protein